MEEKKYSVVFQWEVALANVFVDNKKVGYVRWVKDKEHYGFFALTNVQSYLMLLPRDFMAVMAAVYAPAIKNYKEFYEKGE